MNIVSQIFGIVGMAALFSIYQQKERKKLLLCKLTADIMWVIHYMLLGAVGGAIPNFVGIFRECVFINRDKKWANNIVFPVIFIAVNWLLALSTLKLPINFLPVCASTFVTVSLWVRNPTITKIIAVPVSVTFIIYDIFVGSWAGIVNESIALISILISFINGRKSGY